MTSKQDKAEARAEARADAKAEAREDAREETRAAVKEAEANAAIDGDEVDIEKVPAGDMQPKALPDVIHVPTSQYNEAATLHGGASAAIAKATGRKLLKAKQIEGFVQCTLGDAV